MKTEKKNRPIFVSILNVASYVLTKLGPKDPD